MKIRMFLAAAAAAAIIGGALPARACIFDSRDVQRDIDKADVVFAGTVTGVQHLKNNYNMNAPEYKAVFSVDKKFKGRIRGDTVNVVQMHDTWAYYTHFDIGKKYLLLANISQYGLVVTGCSPVMSIDPASAGSDEPSMEYKFSLASALGEGNLFPMPASAPNGGARKRLEQDNKEDAGQGGGN